jgi:uncharacterized protein (TIGR02757 family)
MLQSQLREFLDHKVGEYNRPGFIESDPVSIPHSFTKKEDIEIAGFFAATIAWGQRPVIIRNARRWMELMDMAPYDFVAGASAKELKRIDGFVHRTFNSTDAKFFILALRNMYKKQGGMEQVFANGISRGDRGDVKSAILHFRKLFLSVPHEPRSEKHIANPASGSNAKRINMFLRWMVRRDKCGVDFGIWKSISPSLLCCPLDVHVGNTARALGLLTRKQDNWKAVEELTENLRQLDPDDPVKYDFALFGLGVFEKFGNTN